MSNQGRRSRRPSVIALVVLLAIVIGAAIGLSHLNSAGETATPVLAAPLTTTPSATPATTETPSPGPVATPSSTPYPAALAQTVVQQYWDFISRREVSRAYDLFSTGAKAATTREQFVQSITHLLDATNGLTALAGPATVSGDTASVSVTLHYTDSSAPSQHTQQLVWESSTWHIDEAGALTATATPAS